MFYNQIVNKVSNHNLKTIFQNAGYLGVIEIVRLIMPFVALPYVLKIIGGENYGLAVYAQTIISYFMIFVNFGLDESAVKDVSINRNNVYELNCIVSRVLIIKGVLFAIGLLLLFVLIVSFPFFDTYKTLLLVAYGTCLSEVLYPVWFYQGIEKMKYMTIVKTTSIVFYTFTVFFFVKEKDDYVIVVLLQSLGNLIAGILSIYILLYINKIRLVKVELSSIFNTFLNSIPFFLSRSSLVINMGLSKIASGILLNMESVATLDVAGKICSAGVIPMQTLTQAAYPHIAYTHNKSFVKKYLKLVISLSLFVAICIVCFSPYVLPFLTSNQLSDIISITQLLSVQVFFCGISIYLGAPVLVSFGYPMAFNLSVIFSTLLLIIYYLVGLYFNVASLLYFVIGTILIEVFVMLYRFVSCKINSIF